MLSVGVLFLIGGAFPSILAQATTARVLGEISDQTGAVLPGASVTVINDATGISRAVVTDDSGFYQAGSLQPGSYQIRAELPGFRTAVRQGIVLTVGTGLVLNLTLEVGEISDEVVVTGEASMVNTTSGQLGDVVEEQAIRAIPLNGRDIAQIIQLQPGVTRITTASDSTDRRIFAVSGARPTMNLFLLDGVNINDYTGGMTPGGASRNMLGLEGVRELRVETSAYSAEIGRAGGGVFNVVTKSGTNSFHGSVYEYHRNDNLEAHNFFLNQRGDDKPEFKRNQFGFSLGGPIIADRTFYFFNYEGLRDRLGVSDVSSTITPELRSGINPFTGATFVIHPEVLPYLPFYPQPRGAILDKGDGTGDYAYSFTQPTDEDHYQGRIDHELSDKDSIYGRYTILDSEQITPGRFPAFGVTGDGLKARNQYLTLEWQRVFSPRFLNTFRVGFSRNTPTEFVPFVSEIPQEMYLVPTASIPGRVNVEDVGGLGSAITGDNRWVNRFQYIDNASYNIGRHSIRFGTQIERMQFNGFNPPRDGGQYSFGDLLEWMEFATGNDRFRGGIKPGSDDPWRSIRQTIAGFYLQEDFRATPRLTLNGGVRWEFTTVPTENWDRLANFRGDVAFSQSATLADLSLGSPWFNLSKKNIEPRLGFAYDITGDSKTALRGGFGIFHNQLGPWLYRTAAFRSPPFLSEIESRDPLLPFPNIYELCVANDPACVARETIDAPEWQMSTPYVIQFNLALQREVLPQTTVTFTYAGSRGRKLSAWANFNSPEAFVQDGRLVFDEDAEEPNPEFDHIRKRMVGMNSWYNSFQLDLNRRFSGGLSFQGAYTFSKMIDEAPGNQTGSTDTAVGGGEIYFYDRTVTRGRSNMNIAHNFTFNVAYDLPFGAGQRWGAGWSGVANAILGDWSMTSLISLTSGPAGTVTGNSRELGRLGVEIEFVDLAPGGDNDPVLGGPDLYFDPDQFAFAGPEGGVIPIGNLGRGTVTLPGLATVDLSFSKDLPLGALSEDAKLQFRIEAFNAFNRTNFAAPELDIFSSRGRLDSDAGRIDDTTTTARQFQLALRLEW